MKCPLSWCDWSFEDPGVGHWSREYNRELPELTGTISGYREQVEQYREYETDRIFMDHWGSHTPRQILGEIESLQEKNRRLQEFL